MTAIAKEVIHEQWKKSTKYTQREEREREYTAKVREGVYRESVHRESVYRNAMGTQKRSVPSV